MVLYSAGSFLALVEKLDLQMKSAFIITGEWLIQEGAKLVAAVCKRPTPAQIRLAKELRGRAANWRKQMDDLTNDTGITF